MCVRTVPSLVWAVRVDRVLLLRDDNQSLVVGCCGMVDGCSYSGAMTTSQLPLLLSVVGLR